MSRKKYFLQAAFAVLCMVSMLLFPNRSSITAHASSGYEFILLNSYSKTMKIGDEAYLTAITSNGKKPSFSSSSSAIASVNTYGKITAKKAGTVKITAKIRNGEASCSVTVKKTEIRLSEKSVSLENGERHMLRVASSTGHPAKFKSSKSSVASVDENGLILAKKPGQADITVTVDKTAVKCSVTVKKPTLRLSKSAISLYRGGTAKLTVTSSSKSIPKWKTNKKSVATVDSNGTVTAVKNGTATVTVTVDGVSKTCSVTVKKPTIKFETDTVTLSVGESYQTKAAVSSKNKPVYASSNSKVATVDGNGKVYAKSKGRAYIYAKEDGAKERMTVFVNAN